MRAFKILLAGFSLLAAVNVADAETTIRITGSTAFRSATVNAIRNLYTANLVYGYGGGSSPGSFTGASKHIFKGDIGSDTNVTIKCSWSGAVDGQLAVASGDTSIKYLEDGGHTLSDTLQPTGRPNLADTTALNGAAGVPSDIAMLDHLPNTTPFKPPGYGALHVEPVGVIAFKWVVSRGTSSVVVSVDTVSGSNTATVADTSGLSAGMTISGNANIPNDAKIGAILSGTTFSIVRNSDGSVRNATATVSGVNTTFVAPAPFSNMTSQAAQALWSTGAISLATITGNAADQNTMVWALGRDAGSGTRLQAFQEAGIGYNSQVFQFEPLIAGGVVTAHKLAVNANTVLAPIIAQHPNPGDGGFTSGGTVAASLQAITSNPLDKDGLPHDGSFTGPTGPAATGYYVSYVGISDAATAINGGAKELTWNGVNYSEVAVQEGRYTFWGYEALAYLATTPPGVKKTIADALVVQIRDTDAPSPKLDTMNCERQSDGGVVLQNY